MLYAVFVRTLKPGVTYEQFRDAWLPERVEDLSPARVSVGRSVSDTRQVITIVEVDVTADQFAAIAPSLTRPGALEKVREIVESTELEGVYEGVFDPASFRPR